MRKEISPVSATLVSTHNEQLIVTVLEYETNEPEKGDFLHAAARTESDGFSGWSDFWVSRRDFDAFLLQLEEFETRLTGEAFLRCGWGVDVSFGLRFFSYDRLGHLGAEVELAAAPKGRGQAMHRFVGEYEIEPSAVTVFRSELRLFTANS